MNASANRTKSDRNRQGRPDRYPADRRLFGYLFAHLFGWHRRRLGRRANGFDLGLLGLDLGLRLVTAGDWASDWTLEWAPACDGIGSPTWCRLDADLVPPSPDWVADWIGDWVGFGRPTGSRHGPNIVPTGSRRNVGVSLEPYAPFASP